MFHDVIAMIGTNPAIMLVKEHIVDTTMYEFYFSIPIYFFQFLFRLLFPFSLWTFIFPFWVSFFFGRLFDRSHILEFFQILF